jgi:preprotein translocase subunit SecY
MDILESFFLDDLPSFVLLGFFIVACTFDPFLIDHKLDDLFHVSKTLELILYFLFGIGFGTFFKHTSVNSPDLFVL